MAPPETFTHLAPNIEQGLEELLRNTLAQSLDPQLERLRDSGDEDALEMPDEDRRSVCMTVRKIDRLLDWMQEPIEPEPGESSLLVGIKDRGQVDDNELIPKPLGTAKPRDSEEAGGTLSTIRNGLSTKEAGGEEYNANGSGYFSSKHQHFSRSRLPPSLYSNPLYSSGSRCRSEAEKMKMEKGDIIVIDEAQNTQRAGKFEMETVNCEAIWSAPPIPPRNPKRLDTRRVREIERKYKPGALVYIPESDKSRKASLDLLACGRRVDTIEECRLNTVTEWTGDGIVEMMTGHQLSPQGDISSLVSTSHPSTNIGFQTCALGQTSLNLIRFADTSAPVDRDNWKKNQELTSGIGAPLDIVDENSSSNRELINSMPVSYSTLRITDDWKGLAIPTASMDVPFVMTMDKAEAIKQLSRGTRITVGKRDECKATDRGTELAELDTRTASCSKNPKGKPPTVQVSYTSEVGNERDELSGRKPTQLPLENGGISVVIVPSFFRPSSSTGLSVSPDILSSRTDQDNHIANHDSAVSQQEKNKDPRPAADKSLTRIYKLNGPLVHRWQRQCDAPEPTLKSDRRKLSDPAWVLRPARSKFNIAPKPKPSSKKNDSFETGQLTIGGEDGMFETPMRLSPSSLLRSPTTLSTPFPTTNNSARPLSSSSPEDVFINEEVAMRVTRALTKEKRAGKRKARSRRARVEKAQEASGQSNEITRVRRTVYTITHQPLRRPPGIPYHNITKLPSILKSLVTSAQRSGAAKKPYHDVMKPFRKGGDAVGRHIYYGTLANDEVEYLVREPKPEKTSIELDAESLLARVFEAKAKMPERLCHHFEPLCECGGTQAGQIGKLKYLVEQKEPPGVQSSDCNGGYATDLMAPELKFESRDDNPSLWDGSGRDPSVVSEDLYSDLWAGARFARIWGEKTGQRWKPSSSNVGMNLVQEVADLTETAIDPLDLPPSASQYEGSVIAESTTSKTRFSLRKGLHILKLRQSGSKQGNSHQPRTKRWYRRAVRSKFGDS